MEVEKDIRLKEFVSTIDSFVSTTGKILNDLGYPRLELTAKRVKLNNNETIKKKVKDYPIYDSDKN